MSDDPPLSELPRVANSVALDFVNTVGSRAEERPHQYVASYRDLVTWARTEGVLSVALGRRLLEEAGKKPRRAARVLREALELREAIHALVVSWIRATPGRGALETLNRALARALTHRRLVARQGSCAWEWSEDPPDLERVVWPIVLSAAELLVHDRPERVRECPGPGGGCGWLFLDTSKNGTRRWCSMETCGNAAKVRRYRKRQDVRGRKGRRP